VDQYKHPSRMRKATSADVTPSSAVLFRPPPHPLLRPLFTFPPAQPFLTPNALYAVAAALLVVALHRKRWRWMGTVSAMLSFYHDSSDSVEGVEVDQYQHPSHLRGATSADITDLQLCCSPPPSPLCPLINPPPTLP
jgi:hypothetical protein